jgi:hypothetical protein
MACYHPIKVGVPKDSFRPGGPKIWVEQTVPCGHCLGCRADQARDWSIRIMHETQMHEQSWFLTLTYSNEEIPTNGSLNPAHLQAFFKALRRDHPPKSISYYACGEYGERTQRPHYHAVLYGVDFLDRAFLRHPSSGPVWRSQTLESYWPHGLSEFSTVTPGSAAYVAGYVRKKVSQKADPNHYTRVDPDTGELIELTKEFNRMSLKPAIGKRWIEKYWSEVYPTDQVVVAGRTFRPPRYYDKWMDQHHPHLMFNVRFNRDRNAEFIAREKLAAKEKIHAARVELYQQRGKV